jgi:predicted GIY-YIG superfamily endonuclease
MKSLIFGYLERIASDVFDNYHKEITALIGKQHGVYALYKKNHLYYVGLAGNLKTRVTQHLKDRHAKKWDRFSLYLIEKAEHIKEIESLLIRIAEPKGNLTKGGLRQSLNLRKALKKSMEQQKKEEIARIFRSGKKEKLVKTRTTPSIKVRTKKLANRRVPPLRGFLAAGTELMAKFKGQSYQAYVTEEGKVSMGDEIFNSPSAAAIFVTGGPKDGWIFWRYKNEKEDWVLLDELRKRQTQE